MLSTAISAHLSITSRHDYSRAGHKTSTPHHCLHLPLCFPPNCSTTIYAYPLQLYLAITSDHHLHWFLHIKPPFSIEHLSLYPSYLLLVSLPCTSLLTSGAQGSGGGITCARKLSCQGSVFFIALCEGYFGVGQQVFGRGGN